MHYYRYGQSSVKYKLSFQMPFRDKSEDLYCLSLCIWILDFKRLSIEIWWAEFSFFLPYTIRAGFITINRLPYSSHSSGIILHDLLSTEFCGCHGDLISYECSLSCRWIFHLASGAIRFDLNHLIQFKYMKKIGHHNYKYNVPQQNILQWKRRSMD